MFELLYCLSVMRRITLSALLALHNCVETKQNTRTHCKDNCSIETIVLRGHEHMQSYHNGMEGERARGRGINTKEDAVQNEVNDD